MIPSHHCRMAYENTYIIGKLGDFTANKQLCVCRAGDLTDVSANVLHLSFLLTNATVFLLFIPVVLFAIECVSHMLRITL
jgi:hypothetical protein